MKQNLGLVMSLFAVALATSPMILLGADRGRLLYENHCIVCHQSTVHIRKNRHVKNFTDIEKYARRFSKLAGVTWSDDELMMVVNYLNRKFYKFKP